MAAFLTVDLLRAHSAPDLRLPTPGAAGGFACPRAARPRRRVPVMRWVVAPSGRLTCRWELDASASPDLPTP